jgi:hypothetical protein
MKILRPLWVSIVVSLSFVFSSIGVSNAAPATVFDCANSSQYCARGLTLQYGDDALSLKATWTAPTAGSPTAYEIYLYEGSDYKLGSTSAGIGSQLSATFTSLPVGTTYSVAVVAQFTSPVSPEFYLSKSSPLAVIDKPGSPTNVVASRTGSGQVNISWDAPTVTGGTPITENQVTCITTCTDSELGTQTLVTQSTSLTLSNLSTNTSRTFKVTAKNSTFTSDLSTASSAITPFSNPTAPGAPVASAGDGTITIGSWGASTVSGATLTKYVVNTYLSTDLNFANPISGKSVTVTNLNSRTATITGLTNGTGYVVRIAAYVGEVVGAFRASSSIVPFGIPSIPGAPSATRSDSTATVSWNTAAANGATIDYYNVTYSTSESGSYSTPSSGTCSANVSGTSCTMTGLTQGSTYYFKVRAHNSAGLSGFSSSSAGLTYPNPSQNIIPSTNTNLMTQSAPVSLPAALKPKQKLSFPIASSSGAALTVSVTGGCKVSKVFKTVKVKVGKKTKKVKEQTGWSVQVLKKGKVCEIRQTSPESNGYAALSASSQVSVS